MCRNIAVFLILGIVLVGNLSLTESCRAETFVQSTADTRLTVAMRVEPAEVQKLVPPPWQVAPAPGGPLKDANFFILFIDTFLAQDPQEKPDKGALTRKVVFAVPAKHTQSGEMVFLAAGGLTANINEVPGPYKNFAQATIRREETRKGVNVEPTVCGDFWEVRDTRGVVIELRIQYQQALLSRAKAEQKNYSAAEPSFFRIYRVDTATDIVKSIPAGIDRVQDYQFRLAVPELRKLFDGTEQLVAVLVVPLYIRQIFLP